MSLVDRTKDARFSVNRSEGGRVYACNSDPLTSAKHRVMVQDAQMLRCTERMLYRSAGVQKDFRHQWIEKWIVDPVPNRIIVRYEDLLRNPQAVVDYVQAHIA